ncbi:MAG: pyridoxamine 5'-phosphate oxidase family protein [Syntrophomonas sp.]
MEEKLTEVMLFANQNPSCWLATSEDNQPHVRGMLMWFADETGFYFHTAKAKGLFQQIQINPKVEAAFIRDADDPVNFASLRVTGLAEVVEDKELEKRLFLERPWIWENIKQAGADTEVVIFRIVNGSAYIWNMSWNLKEKEAPRVTI